MLRKIFAHVKSFLLRVRRKVVAAQESSNAPLAHKSLFSDGKLFSVGTTDQTGQAAQRRRAARSKPLLLLKVWHSRPRLCMFSHAAIVLSRHGLRISCFRRQPTVVLQIIYRLQIVVASAQPRAVCNTSCETRFLSRRFLVLQDASEACGWLPRNSSGADPSPARKQFNQESRVATRGFRVLSSEGKGSQLIVGLLGSKKLNRAQPRAANVTYFAKLCFEPFCWDTPVGCTTPLVDIYAV